jgi:rhodanese-related sulfurtransferase
MKRAVIVLLAGLVALLTVPAFADEGLGEVVSEAAPKGATKVIPPGQFAIVAKYADQFLSTAPGGARTIFASTLLDGIDNPNLADELDDFFLVDVRPTNEFCAGTVPGAINIPMGDLAKAENLAKLPMDKPILIICNTGHTASISNAILGTLGYDAWTLRFGMMGWRAKTNAKVGSPSVVQEIKGAGFLVQTCPAP